MVCFSARCCTIVTSATLVGAFLIVPKYLFDCELCSRTVQPKWSSASVPAVVTMATTTSLGYFDEQIIL